jgi:antibiotic biosynthesis monooxygenase (ABM) superfamily enzyme
MLESWKAALQDLPGYLGSDTMARREDKDTLRFHVRVTWNYREQLEEFVDSPWETENIIWAKTDRLFNVHSEIFENFI